MTKLAPALLTVFLTACAAIPPANDRAPSSDNLPWNRRPGIEAAVIDDQFTVVRVDPAMAPLELLNPPATNRGVGELAARQGYAFLINAAMFATDYATSIGYMRNYDVVNNPQFSSRLRGYFLFHPKKPGLPPVKIGDKDDAPSYHTVFQTHRVWTPSDGIMWKKGRSVYHQVAMVGVDGRSRAVFFYHPGLVDVHDFVTRILELGLDLRGILYLDGGNHGALYLDRELGRSENTWITLPNLLGVKRR